MASVQKVTCDSVTCGRDITEGLGRQWRLMVISEVISMRRGTTPLPDSGRIPSHQHFCDEKCVADQMMVELEKKRKSAEEDAAALAAAGEA